MAGGLHLPSKRLVPYRHASAGQPPGQLFDPFTNVHADQRRGHVTGGVVRPVGVADADTTERLG